MSECLIEEELDRFHGREWDAASMERARRHMSTCTECARRAAAMADEVNHLIENIKEVGASKKPVTARRAQGHSRRPIRIRHGRQALPP